MFPLFESIRIRDGIAENTKFHYSRMVRALGRDRLPFSRKEFFNLLQAPSELRKGIVKARMEYDERGFEINFTQYQKRNITKLVLKNGDHIHYNHKYTDRTLINQLCEGMDNNTDVIIVISDKLTDSSFCNIALYDGNKWVTPTMPLLRGTQRALLIDSRLISQKQIKVSDLKKYQRIRLFNAMMPWEEAIEIDIKQVSV